MSGDIKPYVAAPADAIRPQAWFRLVGDEFRPLGDYIPDWDQNTVLQLESTLDADVGEICSSIELPKSALQWAVGWRAVDTRLVGASHLFAVDNEHVEFSLTIPPERTGKAICVSRKLILGKRQDPTGFPLRAHIPGSILWSDDHIVHLSGRGAAFPMGVIDFTKVSITARLARNSWYLDLPASVDTPTLGGMLLMINSADIALAAAVSSSNPDEEQQLLLSAMEESVVEQLVRWALARWDELPELIDASVGSVVRILAERVLGDPRAWVHDEINDMDLHAVIIEGARKAGFGRQLG